jgi:glycosyltransferase involved in cell wall biosynthesis
VDPLDTEELAQAMESIIADPELAAELRRKGLERAAQFSWKKVAGETLQILRDAARV